MEFFEKCSKTKVDELDVPKLRDLSPDEIHDAVGPLTTYEELQSWINLIAKLRCMGVEIGG